jgi:hypothetical protein
MGKKRVNARIAIAAAAAAVAGILVASVAGAGAQSLPPYTTSTAPTTAPTTTTSVPGGNRPVRLRVALRYKRNQPVSGAIVVRARCRVAGNAAGFVVSQSQGCLVNAGGTIAIKRAPAGARAALKKGRQIRLKGVKVQIRPRQTITMRFRYKKRPRIKNALRIAQRSVDAQLVFNVSDEYGNSKQLRRKVHLRSGTEFRR